MLDLIQGSIVKGGEVKCLLGAERSKEIGEESYDLPIIWYIVIGFGNNS